MTKKENNLTIEVSLKEADLIFKIRRQFRNGEVIIYTRHGTPIKIKRAFEDLLLGLDKSIDLSKIKIDN